MADGNDAHDVRERADTPVVMLVEDEMIIAFDIADQMEMAGFVVDGPYPSNAKALAALNDKRPHVAILDVQLTDGDVYPVAARLSEMHVPIVFHSGHADPNMLRQHYPGAQVCTKPCSSGRLEDAVRSALTQVS